MLSEISEDLIYQEIVSILKKILASFLCRMPFNLNNFPSPHKQPMSIPDFCNGNEIWKKQTWQ